MCIRDRIYFLKKSGLTAVIKKAIAEPPLSPVEIELIATRAILRERSQQLSELLRQDKKPDNPPTADGH